MPIPVSLLEPPHASAPTADDREPPPGATGPVLLATTGAEACDGAVRLAAQLAARTGADVQVLTALESIGPVDVRFTITPPRPGALLAAQRDARLAAVRDQLQRAPSGTRGWPIEVIDGPADEAIARAATEVGARVVVVGRGRHGALGRAVSGETVLRVLRRSDAPVYAAESEAAGLALRVLIATDFSPYAAHAARVALGLVAPDAAVTLAHVWPGIPAAGPARTGWEQAYERALPDLFDRARRALGAPAGMRVETVTLTGRWPGRAIAGFATAAGADLVVSATHGHGFVTRVVVGSVAAELLRGAPCSFLCVPGSAAAHAAARENVAARLRRETVPSTAWAAMARRLTDRHAGALVALAAIDASGVPGPELGPLPLAAIAYDADINALALTFGVSGANGPALTQRVHGVTAVDRLVDRDGTERGLQIVGTDGSALLRFP